VVRRPPPPPQQIRASHDLVFICQLNQPPFILYWGPLQQNILQTVRSAIAAAQEKGFECEIADISVLPLFNDDLIVDGAPPAVVQAFVEQVKAADCFLFACPEYNYNVTPALKNALDWPSKQGAWKGKTAAVMGAGGGCGTARAQMALRTSGIFLDLTFVNNPEVTIQRFTDMSIFDNTTGDLKDAKWIERVADLVDRLHKLTAQKTEV
jgi:chromate reductase